MVIEIFAEDIGNAVEYARKRLGDLQKKAPLVVRNALNKTAKEAKTKDERITKQTYTAKSDIHSLEFKKATTGNLQAVLKDKGANISMTHFKHYAGKRTVSVIINTKNGRKRLGKPPIVKNNREHPRLAFYYNTIFVRSGISRLPIEKMASISSPVMHGNDQTWGTIEDETLQKLYENIEKEIERILGS